MNHREADRINHPPACTCAACNDRRLGRQPKSPGRQISARETASAKKLLESSSFDEAFKNSGSLSGRKPAQVWTPAKVNPAPIRVDRKLSGGDGLGDAGSWLMNPIVLSLILSALVWGVWNYWDDVARTFDGSAGAQVAQVLDQLDGEEAAQSQARTLSGLLRTIPRRDLVELASLMTASNGDGRIHFSNVHFTAPSSFPCDGLIYGETWGCGTIGQPEMWIHSGLSDLDALHTIWHEYAHNLGIASETKADYYAEARMSDFDAWAHNSALQFSTPTPEPQRK